MLRRRHLSSAVPRVALPLTATTAATTAGTALSSSLRHNGNNSLSKEELAKAWMQLSYQTQGYKVAAYDPLGAPTPAVPELQPEFYGLDSNNENIKKMIQRAKQLFCGSFSAQFSHLNTDGQTEWISTQVMNKDLIPAETKRAIFYQLLQADGLEQFFNKRFVGVKRFGLEGGEALIPGLHALIDSVGQQDVKANKIIVGMAHRGRLQVLHNICGKPLWKIFREFNDVIIPGSQNTNKGDVKYHLGSKTTVKVGGSAAGKEVEIECLPNPSHLEAVNPVATGYARGLAERTAKEQGGGLDNPVAAIPVLIHGDAAIIGQGVCFETMLFEEVRDYHVGGTIHVVINNQVGFTTDPRDSRSVNFCTGPLAFLNNSPVIRVNGDQPLRVVEAFRLAVRHREEFHEDVFIDLVCYRRRGHNEGDSPDFTQPALYKKIRKHPTTADIMAKSLIAEGVVTEEEVESWKDSIFEGFKEQYNKANDPQNSAKPQLLSRREFRPLKSHVTGVPVEELKELGLALCPPKSALPKEFVPHKNVWKNCIEQREKSFSAGTNILWASAELLALGQMVKEGVSVRYSGEDIQRGTWAQRHFVLHNTSEERAGEEYCPLKELSKQQPGKYGEVTLANSPLSEYGVLGFEFGFSVARSDTLTLWEAQFGDFANTAQIVFDQFLSASSTKWAQRCGLVISLPHGFDGQGPEHSSARIERFLQNCNEPVYLPETAESDSTGVDPADALKARNAGSNWCICYPSTPANYFHMLRRHMKREKEHRQPLIFFFSKGGLRTMGSKLEEMGPGTKFSPVLAHHAEKKAKTVVLCTGQVFNSLLTRRKGGKDVPSTVDSVAIIRLEQLAPFPYEHLRAVLRKAVGDDASDVRFVWCQEEPKNNGAFFFTRPRLRILFDSMFGKDGYKDIEYAGRPSSGSPATGYGHIHNQQLNAFLELAVNGKKSN